MNNNIISISENNNLYVLKTIKYTYKHRETEKMLQCNVGVTECNTKIETNINIEAKTEKRVDYQKIVNLYNDTCVSFPKVFALSDSRKKNIKARLKTYSMEDFKKLFEMVERSGFLKGENA